jgi:hypothetical protein
MIVVLTILHIALAAAWFGHKLLIPGDIRASIGVDPVTAESFLRRLQRAERLGQITGVGTVLAGFGLAWAVGYGSVRLGVWLGAGLAVAAIGLGALVARPVSRGLREAVGRGDRAQATVAGRRLSQVLNAESLLWLGALTAMIL